MSNRAPATRDTFAQAAKRGALALLTAAALLCLAVGSAWAIFGPSVLDDLPPQSPVHPNQVKPSGGEVYRPTRGAAIGPNAPSSSKQ